MVGESEKWVAGYHLGTRLEEDERQTQLASHSSWLGHKDDLHRIFNREFSLSKAPATQGGVELEAFPICVEFLHTSVFSVGIQRLSSVLVKNS